MERFTFPSLVSHEEFTHLKFSEICQFYVHKGLVAIIIDYTLCVMYKFIRNIMALLSQNVFFFFFNLNNVFFFFLMCLFLFFNCSECTAYLQWLNNCPRFLNLNFVKLHINYSYVYNRVLSKERLSTMPFYKSV